MILAASVAGAVRLTSAQTPPSGPRAPAKATPRTHVDNPVAGLTGEQQMALIHRLEEQAAEERKGFVEQFVQSGRDSHALPVVGIGGDYLRPLPDLQSAIESADAIVVGTVRSDRYTADMGTYVDFHIEKSLKGTLSANITITMVGGPRPSPDGKGELEIGENAPLLLPGDRAVLFLQYIDDDESLWKGLYKVQNITGEYQVQHGRISPVAFSPFARSVDGLTEQQFTRQVDNLLGAQRPTAPPSDTPPPAH